MFGDQHFMGLMVEGPNIDILTNSMGISRIFLKKDAIP